MRGGVPGAASGRSLTVTGRMGAAGAAGAAGVAPTASCRGILEVAEGTGAGAVASVGLSSVSGAGAGAIAVTGLSLTVIGRRDADGAPSPALGGTTLGGTISFFPVS